MPISSKTCSMVYRLELAPQAVQDIADLKRTGCRKAVAKIEKLLVELTLHPKTGTGQAEALKGNLSGFWSRRIDKYNRLIYTIEEEIVTVIVISAKGHYK